MRFQANTSNSAKVATLRKPTPGHRERFAEDCFELCMGFSFRYLIYSFQASIQKKNPPNKVKQIYQRLNKFELRVEDSNNPSSRRETHRTDVDNKLMRESISRIGRSGAPVDSTKTPTAAPLTSGAVAEQSGATNLPTVTQTNSLKRDPLSEIIDRLNDHYYGSEESLTKQRLKTNRIIFDLFQSVSSKKPTSASSLMELWIADAKAANKKPDVSSKTDNDDTGESSEDNFSGDLTESGATTEVKDESGDNLLYQQPEQVQAEHDLSEYDQYKIFCEKTQSMIKSLTGITVHDLQFSFEQFQQLALKYSDCRQWQDQLTLCFQPRVIVVKNFQESRATTNTERQQLTTDTIRSTTEEVFIYTNGVQVE